MRALKAGLALSGVFVLFCIGSPLLLIGRGLDWSARGFRWTGALIAVAMSETLKGLVGPDALAPDKAEVEAMRAERGKNIGVRLKAEAEREYWTTKRGGETGLPPLQDDEEVE